MNLGILKIATFNANSVRARLPVIVDWLGKESPHVLCLQETKVQDADFPVQAFEDLDYHCVFRGQKAYNGVAVVSRKPPESVRFGFGDGDAGEEPRLLAATIGDLAIVNTYVPQGFAPESEKFQYKLLWLERLRAYFDRFYKPTSRLVWLGDFNVAPEAMDIYDPDRLLGRVGCIPFGITAFEMPWIAAWDGGWITSGPLPPWHRPPPVHGLMWLPGYLPGRRIIRSLWRNSTKGIRRDVQGSGCGVCERILTDSF
jgi:exodeoxyribonuclease III